MVLINRRPTGSPEPVCAVRIPDESLVLQDIIIIMMMMMIIIIIITTNQGGKVTILWNQQVQTYETMKREHAC